MKRVVIIGSGNVATSLAHGLVARCEVAQIYSRQLAHAQLLADAIGCPDATCDLDALAPDADAYVIAVKDDASFGFYSNGNWIINNEGDAILQVVDLNGQILSSEEISGCVSKHIEAAPGVYMLRLINGKDMKVQKVVVK